MIAPFSSPGNATKSKVMPDAIQIENIEAIRLQEGIDDVDLRAEIRALKAGDQVKLTLLTGDGGTETILVRITSVRDLAFRGKLVKKPKSSSLTGLDVDSPINFSAANIHSIPKGQPAYGKRN